MTQQENSAPQKNPDNFIESLAALGYLLCSAIVLWAIWSNRFFMLQDLPDHIARSAIIKNYFTSDLFRTHIQLTPFPVPYLIPDLFNALLLTFFSPLTATKIFASLSAFSLVGGVFFFVNRILPMHRELSLLTFGILFTNVFFKGNLGFYFGLGSLFTLLGLWWPLRWNTSFRRDIAVAVGGCLIYGIHLLSLAAWLFIFGASFLWHCIKQKSFEWKKLWPVLPSLLLAAAFFLWTGSGAVSNAEALRQNGSMNLGLFTIAEKYGTLKLLFCVFTQHGYLPIIAGLSVYLLILGIAVYKNRFSEELFIFAALLAGFLIAPRELPDLVRPGERIFLIMIIWGMSLFKYPKPMHDLLRGAWIVCMIGICWSQGSSLQEYLKNLNPLCRNYYEAIRAVPENCLVCTVTSRSDPLQHFGKYVIAERNAITPGLFTCKHLCIRYRKALPEVLDQTALSGDILKLYPYFLISGGSIQFDSLITNRTMSLLWHQKWYGVLKNNTVAQ